MQQRRSSKAVVGLNVARVTKARSLNISYGGPPPCLEAVYSGLPPERLSPAVSSSGKSTLCSIHCWHNPGPLP